MNNLACYIAHGVHGRKGDASHSVPGCFHEFTFSQFLRFMTPDDIDPVVLRCCLDGLSDVIDTTASAEEREVVVSLRGQSPVLLVPSWVGEILQCRRSPF